MIAGLGSLLCANGSLCASASVTERTMVSVKSPNHGRKSGHTKVDTSMLMYGTSHDDRYTFACLCQARVWPFGQAMINLVSAVPLVLLVHACSLPSSSQPWWCRLQLLQLLKVGSAQQHLAWAPTEPCRVPPCSAGSPAIML